MGEGQAHLAEGIEYVVEVDQDLALCDLGDVVHGLAGVVSDTGILVSEAGEDWRHDDFEVPSKLLGGNTREGGRSATGPGSAMIPRHRGRNNGNEV